MAIRCFLFIAGLLFITSECPLIVAQAPQPPKAETTPPKKEKADKADEKAPPKEKIDKKDPATAKEPKTDEKTPPKPPLFTSADGSIIISGQKIEYKATAGMLPGTDKTGKAKANIFFVAYTRKTGESTSTRRLTFCFNGGPGSASAFVHLGFFGPRMVLINDDGLSAPRPSQMVENDCSLLDVTDLVFIDPVSTGYSRAEKTTEAVLFHGLEEDTYSVGEFIRDYVAKYDRKQSPVFIAGESYGTTRSASLASYIQERGGVKLAGIVLISTVLDFQTINFGAGNEVPYALFLPTYTATAFHHGKLDKKWAPDLQTALKAAQKFADGPYLEALHQGNLLSDFERQAVAKQMALLTGVSEDFVLRSDLRVEATRYRNEILRDKQEVVGRYDSLVTGKAGGGRGAGAPGTGRANAGTPAVGGAGPVAPTGGAAGASPGTAAAGPVNPAAPTTGVANAGTPAAGAANPATPGRGNRGGGGAPGGGDPSNALLSGIFTEAIRGYLPNELGYKSEATYQMLVRVQPWNYGPVGTNRYANVAPRLRSALEKNKSLRVFVASGYCDLATPFAATNYTFAHMGPRSLMDQVTMKYYDAGHMIYTHEPERRKLRNDIVTFMTSKPTEAPKASP
jgi:carboxypeptidase C (cathepsin A)